MSKLARKQVGGVWKLLRKLVGGLWQLTCSCCGCDTCCDCVPATVSVVLASVHTSVNGTWSCLFVPDGSGCRWIYEDANVKITVNGYRFTSTGATYFNATAVDKTGPTTRFSGGGNSVVPAGVNHKGACKRIASGAITNDVGTGTATVTGSCTPSAPCASGCEESFDPPVDAVPCVGCCPSCIHTQYSVVLSGIAACSGCCPVGVGFSIDYKGTFTWDASFILERTVDFDSHCHWGDPTKSSPGAFGDPAYSKIIGSGQGWFYIGSTCSAGETPLDDSIAWAEIKWSSGFSQMVISMRVFQGTNESVIIEVPFTCEGGTFTGGAVPCCAGGGHSTFSGTAVATITPC